MTYHGIDSNHQAELKKKVFKHCVGTCPSSLSVYTYNIKFHLFRAVILADLGNPISSGGYIGTLASMRFLFKLFMEIAYCLFFRRP